MKTQSIDTPPDVEEVLVAGYRAMGPEGRLAAFVDLERAAEAIAIAGVRARHGQAISTGEGRLRLAALRLDRDLMIRAFGWDPEERGY